MTVGYFGLQLPRANVRPLRVVQNEIEEIEMVEKAFVEIFPKFSEYQKKVST